MLPLDRDPVLFMRGQYLQRAFWWQDCFPVQMSDFQEGFLEEIFGIGADFAVLSNFDILCQGS